MQHQQQQATIITNSTSSGFVQPWHVAKFAVDEVTTLNFHQRSRRLEVQLPLPEVNPIIRANVLLEESMRHNWAATAKCYQQHAMMKAAAAQVAVDPGAMQEELEFMWFQFRCEWQQLRTDVLSEMFRVHVPEALKVSPKSSRSSSPDVGGQEQEKDSEEVRDQKLRQRATEVEAARKCYLEDLRQAFYPTTLMELFQKDLAPCEPEMNLCLLPSGRGHWSQLQATYMYQQQVLQLSFDRKQQEAVSLKQQAEEKARMGMTSQCPQIAIELCGIDLDEEDDDCAVPPAASHDVVSNSAPKDDHLPAQHSQLNGHLHPSDTGSDDGDNSSVCGLSDTPTSNNSFRVGDADCSPAESPAGSKNNRVPRATHHITENDEPAAAGATAAASYDRVQKPSQAQTVQQLPPPPVQQYMPPAHFGDVMDALSQLTTSEGQQCPLEYHTVRFDEETRAQVFMSRRERKAFVLAALPQGRLFLTI